MMPALAGYWLLMAGAIASPGDDAADSVLGQSALTTNAPNQPGGATSALGLALSNAAHIAIAKSGRLYLSDSDNNRVLSWPSAALFTSGQAADRVIGQPDFVSNSPNADG